MKLNIIAATVIGIATLNSVYAEKVDPVFMEEWYQNATFKKVDSCLQYQYNYINKTDSKALLISTLFADLPKHNNCTWQDPVFVYYQQNGIPNDFPYSVAFNEMLSKNPDSPKPEFWASYCVHKNGSKVFTELKQVIPSYSCPKGSRYDRDIGYCTTTPPACFADVAGRDLGIPGMSNIGHIGMTSQKDGPMGGGGQYVMEVTMGNAPVINIHSLDSFINTIQGGYWGIVYDLPNVDIDFEKSKNILKYGWEQRQFNPEYTPLNVYREGHYIDGYFYDAYKNKFIIQRKYVQALFRCDTFVLYSYLKAGINIKPSKILPKDIYSSFVHKRENISNKSNKEFSKIEFNIENSDLLTDYLKDKKYSRQEKINNLYSQLKNSKTSNTHEYILYALSFMNPFELIPSFVDDYKNENNIDKKVKLIKIITMSAQAIDIKTDVNYDENDASNIYKINKADKIDLGKIKIAQDFILDVLKTETNNKILNESILSAMGILPINRENYFIVSNAMDKMGKSLDIESKNRYLVIMSLNNKDMQKWLLPQLLSKQRSGEDKVTFDNELKSFIGMTKSDDIDKEVKLSIDKYFNGK